MTHALYGDEDFPHPVVALLKLLGHDILTVQDDGRKGNADPLVLAPATHLGRTVITMNGWDFVRLHRQGVVHQGIVSCSQNDNVADCAVKIHAAIVDESTLDGRIIRVRKL